MKKKYVITAAAVLAVALVLLAGGFAYIKKNYPYALYFGDRITGTYSSDSYYVVGDHSTGGIDVYDISCKFGGEAVRVDTDDEKKNFSIKGNEYGKYEICFTINKGDMLKLLALEYMPDKDYKIYVSIVKNKNQIDHLNVHTDFFCENGEWYITVSAEDNYVYRRVEKTQKLDMLNTEIMLELGV